MANTFDAAILAVLRDAKEIKIRTPKQPDRGVIIWVVAIDDDVYIRSVRGAKAAWYKATSAAGHATLEFNDQMLAVRATSVNDPRVIDAVSQAYLKKYATSPYAQPMTRAEVLATTLHLEPA